MRIKSFPAIVIVLLLSWGLSVHAEVRHNQINDVTFITHVNNEPWQPEGVVEPPVLRAPLIQQVPVIDGLADDPAWDRAESITLPLDYGPVGEATLKAVYTDKEVFLLVSWPDASKDDQHRPWTWDTEQGRYVEGTQVEDGLLVSLEEGCDWNPSPLTGYVFDFDGWLWLAARTNPLGQAVDTNGHAQDRWRANMGYTKYQRRRQEPFWNMKFAGRGNPDNFNDPWHKVDRVYVFSPLQGPELYVSLEPDKELRQRNKPDFAIRLPAPIVEPEAVKTDQPPPQLVPQFKPVKLKGNAGDVAAKGQWEDGRWTVEYRRVLITPAKTTSDSMLDRTTQFSIHVFDSAERLDEASESGRILLQFEPDELAQSK
jgi:Ethylbenzene dehydrogenase